MSRLKSPESVILRSHRRAVRQCSPTRASLPWVFKRTRKDPPTRAGRLCDSSKKNAGRGQQPRRRRQKSLGKGRVRYGPSLASALTGKTKLLTAAPKKGYLAAGRKEHSSCLGNNGGEVKSSQSSNRVRTGVHNSAARPCTVVFFDASVSFTPDDCGRCAVQERVPAARETGRNSRS